MFIKTNLAKFLGKVSYLVLHNIFNGGTSFPGKLAVKIDHNILEELASDYEVILVTGTNGKTMTTSIITEALKEKYGDVLTNPSGSNMLQGIITAFLAHRKKHSQRKIAVLEVDEAYLKIITTYLKPKVVVLTNIFRDQMDRYGEIYTTYEKIITGIKNCPDATIVANGDASIFSSDDLTNQKIFYGFDLNNSEQKTDLLAPVNTDGVLCAKCHNILHYHEIVYANLGNYFCPKCNFHRPKLKYTVNEIVKQTPKSLTFKMGTKVYQMAIGGTYNIYNALAAYSVAKEFGLSDDEIARSFSKNKRIFGRQELINYSDKEIILILVKNPVGLDSVLNMLNTENDDYSLITLLNANHADGIDTSWIWDSNYESLHKENIKHILVGGLRYQDMHLRLKVAGFNPKIMETTPTDDELIDAIPNLPCKKIYILSTYTAMLSLRKKMAERKIINGNM